MSQPASSPVPDQADAAEGQRSCPDCGRDNADRAPLGCSRDQWRVKACRGCGFVYLENAPDYQALASDFAWHKTYLDEKAQRRRGRRLHYLLSDAAKAVKYALRGGPGGQHLKVHWYIKRYVKAGRVLDIGCSRGRTLWNLREDLTPYGIEISEHLAQLAEQVCRPRGGFVVRDNALSGLERFEENFFTGLVLRAFLEHEIRPRELLAAALRVLAPGGCAIIKVPNYGSVNQRLHGRRWCGYRFPDHVNYFTPRTLERMLQAAGFSVRRFRLFDRWPLSDNMWMVAGKGA